MRRIYLRETRGALPWTRRVAIENSSQEISRFVDGSQKDSIRPRVNITRIIVSSMIERHHFARTIGRISSSKPFNGTICIQSCTTRLNAARNMTRHSLQTAINITIILPASYAVLTYHYTTGPLIIPCYVVRNLGWYLIEPFKYSWFLYFNPFLRLPFPQNVDCTKRRRESDPFCYR